MKKLIITCIAATTLSLGSYAFAYDDRDHGKNDKPHYSQDADGKSHKGHHSGLKRMAKALELTEDQVAEIKALHRQAREDGDSRDHGKRGNALMMLDPSASDYSNQVAELAKLSADKTEQRIIKRGELHAQIYALLTPEQQEKAKALREKRQKRLKD